MEIVFVEKQGTVIKMMPFAQKVGVAFIDSQGFGSEHGVALARLCNQQAQPARDYTQRYYPQYRDNLASLTDCDASGVGIGIKVNGATRIGINLDTIEEINHVNQGLGFDVDLQIKDLREEIDTTNNTHFMALEGILEQNKEYDSF